MAKKGKVQKNVKNTLGRSESFKKKTSIGGSERFIKFSSMNKNKKRNFKAYRGQGR